jgi:glycosyltransferase involved in cell wall biosynthesis
MAAGTPVVQPAHGAFIEILGKTRGGLLTESGCAADLALKLDALAQDRNRLMELGRNAAEGVRRHYTLPLMADRTAGVYKSVSSSVIGI